jgi:outer membrane receptor for ferrienterochelin and colicins
MFWHGTLRYRAFARSLRSQLVVLFLLVAVATQSRADGVADEADLQFQLGATAYAKNNFENALEHFLASNRLVPNRNVMFNIARAFEQLGRFADAYRYYVDAGRDGSEGKLATEVANALTRIAPKVVVIHVDTTPPGATVYVNRKNLGSVGTTPSQLGLPAAQYVIIAELAGYEPYQSSAIDGKIGGDYKVQIKLKRILGNVSIPGVASDAGTEVRFDQDSGAPACTLPCIESLTPGEHTAYFRKPGFSSPSQRFTVSESKTVELSVELGALTGSLLVSAEESNAQIEIDGKLAGFTPTVVAGIAVGQRHVRITLSGFTPVERDVEIKANNQTDITNLPMVPERSVAAASRESENIDDAPASVTVISRRELEAFAYPTVLESLRGVRGFATGFDSIYGTASVRGLGQANDYNNRLLVLSDGAVLNDLVLYQSFIHYDGRADLGDVERIEIVRGPASVLYGNGAVSGVINLVMRDRQTPNGITVETSSYDNQTGRLRLQGTYHRDDAGVWASVAAAGSQGRNATLNFPLAPNDPVTANTVSTFDKFGAGTVTGKAWYKHLSMQWFATGRQQFVPAGNGTTFNDPKSVANDGRGMLELKYQIPLNNSVDIAARAVYNYAFFKSNYGASDASITQVDYRYSETYRSHNLGAELRSVLRLGKNFKLTAAAEAIATIKQSMHGKRDDQNAETLSVEAPSQLVAGSLLLDWKLSSKLRINGGVRVDYTNLQGNSAAAGGTLGKDSFLASSPRLAIITKPTGNDIVKVILGRAFRAPSTYELFYSDGGISQISSAAANSVLRPEIVYSGELEYTRRFDRVWSVLAAAHGFAAQGIVETTDAPNMPGVVYYRNSPVGELALGADLEVRRELRSGITASAYYGYLRGRYRSSPNPDSPELPQSLQLPNAPTHFAGAKIIFPISNSITGAIRAAFEDRRRIDPTVNEKSGRAVVADAVVSGRLPRFGVHYAVGVYNLFNWRYAVPAVPFSTNLMPQNGRSFIFSLGITR